MITLKNKRLYINLKRVYELAYLKYMNETKQHPKTLAELRKVLKLVCEDYNVQTRFGDGRNRRAYVLPIQIEQIATGRYVRYKNFEFELI